MKKTHVEVWGYDKDGKVVANGLVTPGGICGSTSRLPFTPRYGIKGFGYGITDLSLPEWKRRVKRDKGAIRFQRVIVDF